MRRPGWKPGQEGGPMERYTIVVTVEAEDQREAFHLVEDALSEYVMRHEVEPDVVHISTPDGTRSVSW